MLNPRTLQVFVAIADLGSISKAAATSGVAQSAISRQIADLEQELEGRLFYRTGRGLVPTELAHSILPRTRNLLAEIERYSEDARAHSGNPAGAVDLGLVPAVSAHLASELFNRIREQFPKIMLRIFEGNSGQIEEWLASGKLDAAIFNHYRLTKSRAYERLLTTDMVLVGAVGSRAVKHDVVDFDALAGLPLTLPSLPNSVRTFLDAKARTHGFALRIEIEANSSATIKDLIAHNALFSPMAYHAVVADLRSKRLQAAQIVGPSLKQELVLATGTQRPLTIAARQVARILPDMVRELVPVWASHAKHGS